MSGMQVLSQMCSGCFSDWILLEVHAAGLHLTPTVLHSTVGNIDQSFPTAATPQIRTTAINTPGFNAIRFI